MQLLPLHYCSPPSSSLALVVVRKPSSIVNCANPECPEAFTNKHSSLRMEGDWNHRDKKVHEPSEAARLGIDTWMQELKREK